MNLQELIGNVNREEFAKRYDVSVHAVHKWRSGERWPSVKTAKKIMKDYRLGWEDIYGPVK